MAPRSLVDLAAHVGGEVLGDRSLEVTGVNGLERAGPGELSFYGSPRYRLAYEATRASAVLVPATAPARPGLTVVRVENPHLAFAKVSALFHGRQCPDAGVSQGAKVHATAQVDAQATVMAGAFVGQRARVGPRSVLYPGVFVGDDAAIGADCTLHANVSVREGCIVGDRVILHCSCVIGSDGFGFAFDPAVPEHFKIPQAGIVRIEDDVEIGACSCVDRATMGETTIGKGTKIDNLVQIAHNVSVGPLSLICAQAGVSGSTELGTGVVLAGQVGVIGHIRVGDMAKVGAQAGVARDVPDGAVLSGSPAIDHRTWLRSSAAFERLAELVKEVRALRTRLDELEARP